MAAREFHGVINNHSDNPLVWVGDGLDHGDWTAPWYPSKVPGAGRIAPGGEGKWRSESAGFLTGTAGWALWSIKVVELRGFENRPVDHVEYVRVSWSIPWVEDDTFDVKWAVFPWDPRSPGNDDREAVLELAPILRSEVGNESALAQAAQIAPYVLSLPIGWFFGNPQFPTHPRCQWTLQKRPIGRQSSPLTFPTNLPSDEMLLAGAFRQRMQAATQMGYGAGVPNFYEATYGREHVGGTLLIHSRFVEFRDIPLTELGGVGLDEVPGRIRAVNLYAAANGFVGGIPTFFHANYGKGIVCGAILLKSSVAEYKSVPASELGNPKPNDVKARFKATNDWAINHGFVGGFPTMADELVYDTSVMQSDMVRKIRMCGIVLLKPGCGDRRDVVISVGPA